jgi:type IV pilus assembly protein PilB
MAEEQKETEKKRGKSKLDFQKVLPLAKIPKIKKEVLDTISQEIAEKYKMIVFDRKQNLLKVAMVDSQNLEAINILQFLAEKERLEIEVYSITPKLFQEVASQYGSTKEAVKEAAVSLQSDLAESRASKSKDFGAEARETIQDAPVSKLVQVIIEHAIEGRASDIHIEPIENNYRVRYRVDGILHSSLVLPKDVGRAVVSRVKILSNLKIDEKRKPQDGRFKIDKEEGETVDFRVSTFPVVEGEKVVMRVLDKSSGLFDLESLGITGKNHETLLRRIRDPFGIILLTGPTGSGKSTTLYAFLQILNKEERNIVTLEDPVEYFVEGINQSQIKPEIGYTFANGLRSILRQDPNIIMVGEIRDSETAELAIHAALTGHLVFSTLHTNDSIGAIPRLMDMNVEPFLLSYSLRITAAQRLVRKICDKCKKEIEISPIIAEKIKEELKNIPREEAEKYGVDLSKELKFYQGKGCEACGNLGFRGRLAIFEVLEINDNIQKIISEGENVELKIRKEAKDQGMITIKQDGLLKVLAGLTTLSEVERVTEGSMSVGGDIDDNKARKISN